MQRTLGRSGIEVSAIGMGCWAIGGPFWRGDRAAGWGNVDDDESIRAIHAALDHGATFFDTADVYGTGHSEEVLGKALAGRWEGVVVATKFGNVFDPATRQITGSDASPAYIRSAVEASLHRLGTDTIDLYQFHTGGHPLEEADDVRDTLEALANEGKIRSYGWSTDDLDRVKHFAQGPHCTAVQQQLNVFTGNTDILDFCEAENLASVNRGPLAMGLLSGKFGPDSTLPPDDVRAAGHGWMKFFTPEGKPSPEFLAKLDAIREVLTSEGRTMVQGALAWIWARSPQTVPIPGFKSVKQVEENAGAMQYGPLKPEQMAEIDRILGR